MCLSLVVENQLYRGGCLGGSGGVKGRRRVVGRSDSGYGQIGKELEYHAGGFGLDSAEMESQG